MDDGGIKMNTALKDNLKYDSEEMKFYLEEKVILDITELIAELMEKRNIKKTTLAEKLQKSKGYITQLLDGRANMTLRTVANVLWALDSDLVVRTRSHGFEIGVVKEEEYISSCEASPWPQPTIRLLSTSQKGKEPVETSKWLKRVG